MKMPILFTVCSLIGLLAACRSATEIPITPPTLLPTVSSSFSTSIPSPIAIDLPPTATSPAPGMLAPSLGGDQLSPTWSPDGQKVVFVNEDLRTVRRSLYSVDLVSRELSRLTNSSTNDILPQFSPDGKNILFISQWFGSDPSPKTTIMVMDYVSGEISQISDGVDYIIEAAWSPDSSRIAFVASRGEKDRLWITNLDGSNQHPLTPDLNVLRNLAWSPNGSYVEINNIAINQAGDSAVELHVINVENGADQRLPAAAGQPIQPAWSKDSQKLYYLSQSGQALFSITLADMKKETALTFPSVVNDYSISPDGARIAYSMTGNNEVINLYVSDIDGGDLRCYLHQNMNAIFAVWSPDNKRLVFTSFIPHVGPTQLYAIQVDELSPCSNQAAQ